MSRDWDISISMFTKGDRNESDGDEATMMNMTIMEIGNYNIEY